MQIRYLSDFPFSTAFGGKEIQMLQYRDWLVQNRGVGVELLDYWNRTALDDVNIIHLFGLSDGFLPALKSLKTRNAAIRVVLSSNYYVVDRRVRLSSLLGRYLPIPNYFTVKRGILQIVDGLIVNSEEEGAHIQSMFGKLPYDPTVIPNAVEDQFTQFLSPSGPISFLKEFDINPGYLLSVAFLDERKNTLRLIESFLAAQEKIGRRLVLIGGERFQNRTIRNRVQSLIKENAHAILHIPSLPRDSDLLKSAYLNCHGHLLISHLETPGIASLEALAFGKPLLVGDCKPVREYFEEVATFVDPSNGQEISDAIVAFANREAPAVPTSLTDRFRLSTVGTQLETFYRGLL